MKNNSFEVGLKPAGVCVELGSGDNRHSIYSRGQKYW